MGPSALVVEGHPHRMRDLVRLTGLPAPTIHFYAQQGLLPPARKTAGNQARYTDATVERVVWIRTLQQHLHLPLRTIRWVLERWGELPVDEIRALQALGSLMDEPDPAATAEELARGLEALEPTDLDDLRELGLVAPRGQPLTSSDARLIELVGAVRAAGLTTAAGFPRRVPRSVPRRRRAPGRGGAAPHPRAGAVAEHHR